MDFFSKLSQAMFPNAKPLEASQAQDLVQTVDNDRKMLHMAANPLGGLANPGFAVVPAMPVCKDATHTRRGQSSLSPFASRILEKAKIEQLKSDDQRQKFTSPAQLFASGEASQRIGHIESLAFEKSRHQADQFVAASKPTQVSAFTSFMKSAEEAVKR